MEPAGDAAPGDLVEVDGSGRAPVVARRYSGGDDGIGDACYPGPGAEVARLPRSRLRALIQRARALAATRSFFDRRDFVEVDPPQLVRAPGLEVHLDAIAAGDSGWLATSPEYQMKRLLAAGLERLYALCHCFRAGEVGPHHQPEFAMVEWYRAWAGLDAVVRDTEELVAEVVAAGQGAPQVDAGGRVVDLTPPWPRMSVAEAMARWAGVAIRGDEEAGRLAERVAAAGIDTGRATEWDDLFYCAFVAKVEPRFAELDRPLVLVDWPVRLAALAQVAPGRPQVVERFEAYVAGLELCNGFGELTDPVEQRRRFEEDQRRRAERGRPVYPIDQRLLAALTEGIPPSAGNALGFDRLVMLATGSRHIRDVVWFAADEL